MSTESLATVMVDPWPTASSEDCQSAGNVAFVMSILLALGMLISYLPQVKMASQTFLRACVSGG